MSLTQRLNNVLFHPALLIACRFIMGFLFLYSGIGKLADPAGLLTTIENYDLLPPVLVTPFAVVFPWAEIVLGAFFFMGLFTRLTGALLIIVLGVFIYAMGTAVARGASFDCGCFDFSFLGLSEPVSVESILRDVLFIGMVTVVTAAPGASHVRSVDLYCRRKWPRFDRLVPGWISVRLKRSPTSTQPTHPT